jgi:ABC-type multidrug transport system, ATPase and permease components
MAKYVLETDLGHDLSMKGERVEVDDYITVREGEKVRLRVPLKDVSKVTVEEGLGVDKLVLHVDGKEVEACYSTPAKREELRRLARAIESGAPLEKREEEHRQSKASTLSWLLKFMAPYKRKLLAGVLISIALTGLNLIPPYLLKILIDSVLLGGHERTLFIELTAILAGSYGAYAISSAAQSYVLNTTGQRVVNDFRARLFQHVINQSSSFIDRMSSGRIISRLTTDVGNTQWLMVWGLPTLTVNILTLVGIGVILFTMDVYLALFVVVPTPAVIFLLLRYRSRSHKLYHRNWRRNSDVISTFSDTIPNYMVVKSFAREGYEVDRFGRLVDRLYDAQKDVTKMNVSYWPLIGLITSLATVAIWWVGGNQVIVGKIQLGVITAFIAYLSLFYGPINNLSNVIPFVQQAITSGERIREVLESKPDVIPPKDPKRPSMKGEVKFQGIWFGYDPLTPVLKGIDLTVRQGEKVAVVGKSGSGKSTLSKLLLRFYDPNEGKVTVNGVDLREIDLQYLRSRVGYVPQESVLFDNTVAYNISYGSLREVTSIEIVAAAVAARIHDEIMSLPLAYDTNMGERGNFLSGGQKQRISIARALLKDPDIVIFDEATSNLDVENERDIYGAIMGLSRGRTTIFITHNVHEVMSSERVVVMKDGVIVEEGPPRELMAKNGELKKLFGDQVWEERKVEDRDMVEEVRKLLVPEEGKFTQSSRPSRVNLSLGGVTYTNLIPRLAFPVSDPGFLVLYDSEGKMVGILEDYRRHPGSDVLRRAVSLNDLVVKIKGVKKIELTGEELRWTLLTDRGEEIVVSTKGRRNVIEVDGRVVLVDVNERVFDLELGSLDQRSRKLISQIL